MNTNQEVFQKTLTSLQKYFFAGKIKSYEARITALYQLERMVRENIDAIQDALYQDLKKPAQETFLSEVAFVLEEIAVAKKNLKKWMKPQNRRTSIPLWPARSKIYSEPLGIILIIGPWNYPFQLIFAPLVGAIAAGNCSVLKPSELTPHTAQLIEALVSKYFSSEFVKVINGGVSETTALLNLKFDHIFFTGSTSVGKIVMQAAAKNLIPVTLELGGKSPVIVTERADIDLSARRIVWGKFFNAGQTCVAPDYLYAHERVADVLTEKMKVRIKDYFGESPQQSQSFARIINRKNCERLATLVDSKKVRVGGTIDLNANYIEPTIVADVDWNDPIMSEEIFGPVLPVLIYENLDELFQILKSKPKPLSAYLFSESSQEQSKFIDHLSFGGGCINDVLVHLGTPHLPFGGVGASGFGNYHGANSFKTFSHEKSVMKRFNVLDVSLRYPPYTDKKLNFLRKFF